MFNRWNDTLIMDKSMRFVVYWLINKALIDVAQRWTKNSKENQVQWSKSLFKKYQLDKFKFFLSTVGKSFMKQLISAEGDDEAEINAHQQL